MWYYVFIKSTRGDIMTAKQRKDHIESIRSILKSKGWNLDRWGNFKKPIGGRDYRFKFQKTSLRFETKNGGMKIWSKLISGYFKNITIGDGKLIINNKVVNV